MLLDLARRVRQTPGDAAEAVASHASFTGSSSWHTFHPVASHMSSPSLSSPDNHPPGDDHRPVSCTCSSPCSPSPPACPAITDWRRDAQTSAGEPQVCPSLPHSRMQRWMGGAARLEGAPLPPPALAASEAEGGQRERGQGGRARGTRLCPSSLAQSLYPGLVAWQAVRRASWDAAGCLHSSPCRLGMPSGGWLTFCGGKQLSADFTCSRRRDRQTGTTLHTLFGAYPSGPRLSSRLSYRPALSLLLALLLFCLTHRAALASSPGSPPSSSSSSSSSSSPSSPLPPPSSQPCGSSLLCLHGSACEKNVTGGEYCHCQPPLSPLEPHFYVGPNCSMPATMCDDTPTFFCANGAVCEEVVEGERYRCLACPPAFSGLHCSDGPGKPCGSSGLHCFNGGVCHVAPITGAASCECPRRFSSTPDCSAPLPKDDDFDLFSSGTTEDELWFVPIIGAVAAVLVLIIIGGVIFFVYSQQQSLAPNTLREEELVALQDSVDGREDGDEWDASEDGGDDV